MNIHSLSSNAIDSMVMYTRNDEGHSSNSSYSGYNTNKFKKGYSIICDFCMCKGHNKEQL